ncbi:molecular chaperone TorD [Thaumasiovibrio sp. DFM-14]|uniref:molecular chaperone TorD n=1 Tax=Thaumasiovibrio sp. DFM-14 TaxID=3384792 RepID=UPI0039A33402
MSENRLVNENRAQMYWWFSSLFFTELSEKQLQHYLSHGFYQFLNQLSQSEELQTAADSFLAALNKVSQRDDAQIELAADFCGLFLTGNKSNALPYASIYLTQDKLMFGEPALELQQLMHDHNIGLATAHKEPADHLAIILDFIGNLAIKTVDNRHNESTDDTVSQKDIARHTENRYLTAHLNEQLGILEKYVQSWLPQFNQRCQQCDPFGFYAAAAELLIAYINYDIELCKESILELQQNDSFP